MESRGQFEGRRATALGKLSEKIDDLKKKKPYLWNIPKELSEDLCTLYIDGKLVELCRLAEDIKSFENPGQHFTKNYIAFEGRCGKLQRDLDEVDVTGRPDLQKYQRETLDKVRNQINILSAKVHKNGEACTQCKNCNLKK